MGIFLGPRTDPYLFVSSAFVPHFLFQDLGKTSTQCRLGPPLSLHFVIFGKKVLIGRELFNALPQGRSKSAQTPTSGADKGHKLGGSAEHLRLCLAETPLLMSCFWLRHGSPQIKSTRIKSSVTALCQ